MNSGSRFGSTPSCLNHGNVFSPRKYRVASAIPIVCPITTATRARNVDKRMYVTVTVLR